MDNIKEKFKSIASILQAAWYVILICGALVATGEVLGLVKAQEKTNETLTRVDERLANEDKELAKRVMALEIENATFKEKVNTMYEWMRDDRKARGKSVQPNATLDK
jgi:hypothetical protein